MTAPFAMNNAYRTRQLVRTVSVLGLLSVMTVAGSASAQDGAWSDTLKFSGHVEGGITGNTAVKTGANNLGNLFNDKANQPMLNQVMATFERPMDNKSADYDIGFKLQGIFGTDARMTHGFAEFDHLFRGRNQADIVEASISAHLPVLTEGGLDLKVGQFPTPMGAEVIDATGNYLYSHSYIYNFGIPLKQTGFLVTAHVNSMLDLYAGLDTGVNAFVGPGGYNNDLVKGQFGFGLNLLDGSLTVLGFSHIGAENPNILGFPRSALRYLNDITTTWKVNDDLTLINDMNYIADEGLGGIGYGDAQYAVYTLNDHVSLVGRAEIWRDNKGSFVAGFPGQFDYINAERGLPATTIAAPATTYGSLTFGVNYKPDMPKMFDGFVIRPELRVDHSLNGTKPFNIGSGGTGEDSTSFTPAVDFVLPF